MTRLIHLLGTTLCLCFVAVACGGSSGDNDGCNDTCNAYENCGFIDDDDDARDECEDQCGDYFDAAEDESDDCFDALVDLYDCVEDSCADLRLINLPIDLPIGPFTEEEILEQIEPDCREEAQDAIDECDATFPVNPADG